MNDQYEHSSTQAVYSAMAEASPLELEKIEEILRVIIGNVNWVNSTLKTHIDYISYHYMSI